ncbi:MAG: Rid family detoxifying hydrolase [Firmicutes bacterium]|nr:Rid family detoxifying hydrolase [Bacillota bacterium]
MKKVIYSTLAPKAIGPYSQAIMADNTLYVSGQLPILTESGNLIEEKIELQTEKVLSHIKSIILEAGFQLTDVVKTTVYLSSMTNFPAMNLVYASFFGDHKPARVTIEVARLPKNALIEIDCICVK